MLVVKPFPAAVSLAFGFDLGMSHSSRFGRSFLEDCLVRVRVSRSLEEVEDYSNVGFVNSVTRIAVAVRRRWSFTSLCTRQSRLELGQRNFGRTRLAAISSRLRSIVAECC
jgi:hypothetical protein